MELLIKNRSVCSGHLLVYKYSFKVDSHIACRAHAVPLPCRAAKSLECVFPI